ncbi:hypothetical protein NL676_000167 [Syzygium grande]|nr:hypothetical protein NL676_000167 [Syzygium grande]
MAVGVVMSNEPTALYNGRITAFVAISCMVAATGGIIFGYDIGISGGVTSMEPFLKKFFGHVYNNMKEDTKISNYCKYDSQRLTSFTSSLYISGLVASFFASSVTRAFGRKPSILVGGLPFFAGIGPWRIIGLGESASLLSAVVTGLVGTISTFISMLLVDKLGRRKLFMIGGVQMLASQAMVGGILAAKLGDHGGISKAYAYSVLVLICIYVSGFAWSWGPLGWLVPSEIYPLEIRSAGQSITVAVGFLFTFLVAQTFLSMLCHFKSGIFFFFGGWVVIMTVFVYLLLPETKNVPIEQMDKVWREHWFWKNVVGTMDVHINKTEA